MTGILAFIVVFGVLVTVHELGHLIFAKRAGIMCPEFAIGMGPKIFSYKYNDTLYTVRLLPVGGYVRMASEEMEINPLNAGMRVQLKTNESDEITHIILDDKHNFTQIEEVEVIDSDITKEMFIRASRLHDGEEITYKLAHEAYFVENSQLERIAPRSARFESKSVWHRFMTLAAGPLMNFALAFALFTVLFYINGKPTDEAVVGFVAEDTPAEEAGLQEGDRLETINGETVEDWNDMSAIIQAEGETPLDIDVTNDGESRTVEMTPIVETTELPDGETTERLIIGIGAEMERGALSPILWGAERTYEMGTLIFRLVVEMFGSIVNGTFSFDMLNGPVGIYKVTEEVAAQGLITLINFTAVLSVNLGIMNLLPIPALDGGRILFVLYEGIFRKPLNKKVELNIQLVGVLFLLMVMILVTWNDIKTFFL
ncbi:RIP metalloprotease RseP [Salinicoccus hispanicus]|uniref:Zinc metalloprotease n=1 Tax=Salinicoccus hispanicus TaxID=157225 RepID=A0A6N8TYV2_9STAP|nr:RIP metalloprotease RseP [Salinicoccus hispanicus]MXQ49886.1 RIP metalloprotease RseP [Salinicoccus hispanicus]